MGKEWSFMNKRVVASILMVFWAVMSLFPLVSFADAPVMDLAEYDAVTVSNIMQKTSVFELKAKSALLMEVETGKVLLEKNSHERLPMASVTKVMSMLLFMEAIDSGKLSYDDIVTASEHASSMGGSQAYIEPGEEFSVRDALKAVAIHSSNDVTVALAEKISGSEEVFVAEMNRKAEELGMDNTKFQDTTGLADEDHYSSAYDIAIMSRELILKHPDNIFEPSRGGTGIRLKAARLIFITNSKLKKLYNTETILKFTRLSGPNLLTRNNRGNEAAKASNRLLKGPARLTSMVPFFLSL
jgi:D-alanyl-D-alanine carboxypeptidase (penicillin-binding protein 5/6)